MKSTILAGLVVTGLFLLVTGCQRAEPKGPQTVSVAVTDAGFVPAEIAVKKGEPVVFLVTRTTDATCAKEIVIPGAHVRKALPLNQEVRITFTPEKKGDLRYVCGMDMVSGTFKVQ
jgi:plastocyanin domain-containing protein